MQTEHRLYLLSMNWIRTHTNSTSQYSVVHRVYCCAVQKCTWLTTLNYSKTMDTYYTYGQTSYLSKPAQQASAQLPGWSFLAVRRTQLPHVLPAILAPHGVPRYQTPPRPYLSLIPLIRPTPYSPPSPSHPIQTPALATHRFSLSSA